MNVLGRSDVVVVGAGVIGLATAFRLLQRGRSVIVVERDLPAAGSSGVAAGMLAPICEAEDSPDCLIEFGQRSLAGYPTFVREVEELSGRDAGYRDEGTLWVALNRDDRMELERLQRRLQDRDLAVEPLDRDRLQQLEPHLSPRVVRAFRVAGDHQVEPKALVTALQQAIQRLGGKFLCPGDVAAVETDPSGAVCGVRLREQNDHDVHLACDQVVIAAGAWSSDGIRMPDGGESLPIRPVKGQILRLRGEPLIEHVIRTPDVYLVPRRDGRLIIGATVEEMGFDDAPSAGATMDLLRHGWEVLPGSYDLEFQAVDVGFRPASSDHLPVIGRGSIDGLWWATGHYRNGILLAPATADALAESIVAGAPVDELADFDPQRALEHEEIGS